MRIGRSAMLVVLLFAFGGATFTGVSTREVQFTHGSTVVRGVLAWNEQVKGKRPGVLVVHGGWGYTDNVREQAKRLAESGYVGYGSTCTAWGRSAQTVAVTPPARWTRPLFEQFVTDLCATAGITDLTLVEFRGGPEPGLVTVNGNGHALTMALPFIPDAILGPWLLGHREDGNVWSAVYRPQPRDLHGAILAPG